MTTVLQWKSAFHSFPQFSQVLTGRLAIVSNLISRGRIVLRIEKASKLLTKKKVSKSRIDPFSAKNRCQKNLQKKMWSPMWSSIQAKPRFAFWTLLLCSRSLLLEPRGSGPVGQNHPMAGVCFIRIPHIKTREGAMDNDAKR